MTDLSTPPPHAVPDTDFKYWAFISYSHQDESWAKWLHCALETYRVPRSLVGHQTLLGPAPRRLFPIFRDREELPGAADLSDQIDAALRRSRALIVICSPRSAVSRWVNEEIKTFKALGREGHVFCLIVDGEPNATDKPELGMLECFPEAVRYRVGADGDLTDQRTEPIAADAREGKDGKLKAKLKLLAGVLGVGFDELHQRERRREALRRLRLMSALAAAVLLLMLTYIAAADSGFGIWKGAEIRDFLDARHWSQFRPVISPEKVEAAAAVQRAKLFDGLAGVERGDGWVVRVFTPPKPEDREVWSHSQATTALFSTPNPEKQPRLKQLLRTLERPFVSNVPTMAPIDVKTAGGGVTHFGWVPHPYWCYTQAQPALWTAAAIATALSRPGLITGAERTHFIQRLQQTQQILTTYQPVPFVGGWSTFPSRPDPQQADAYATTLALLALLETKDAGIGWNGSAANRDRLISQTAGWLVSHYSNGSDTEQVAGKTGADSRSDMVWLPGWSASGEPHTRTFDGLTLQIYATLLQAESDAGFHIPANILSMIPRHLALCVKRDLDFPNDAAEFASTPFTAYHGHKVVGLEQVAFLWYPWAIDCTARWLEHARRFGAKPLDRTQVQRSYGHLVVDLGGPAVQRDLNAGWTYLAVEHLIGLSAVPLR